MNAEGSTLTTAEGVDLRPPTGAATALRRQISLVGRSRRWLYLPAGLALLLLLAQRSQPGALPRLFVVGMAGTIAAVLWSMVVWAPEGQDGDYHRALPVHRAVHDLARVVAGGFYLLASYALVAALGAVLALTAGELTGLAEAGAAAWTNYFAAPLLVYFLMTPFVLWRHTAFTKWWIGLWVATIFLGFVASPVQSVIDAVFSPHGLGLGSALLGGMLGAANPEEGPTSWWAAFTVWSAIALALTVVGVAWRPADVLRRLRLARDES